MGNMVAIWISAILLVLFRSAAAFYNPAICAIQETSTGLIPPPLPDSFEMKAEEVNYAQNFSVYQELYFDFANSRAKIQYLMDTIEFHSLYDFQTQQVVQWSRVHPGVISERDPLSSTCKAVDMATASNTFIFGKRNKRDRASDYRILTSNQVLRYGGPYLYAASGSEKLPERGMQANAFTGCVYDDAINTTTNNKYYFADVNRVAPSGGTPSIVRTEGAETPLSVPLQLHMDGSRSVGDKEIPINTTINISWFKGDPVFEPQVFQIPPWIHCDNYKGRKEKPQMPEAFSTRVTIQGFQVDILGQLQPDSTVQSFEEIFYDYNARLARRDFYPNRYLDSDVYEKFGGHSRVSMVYDFNEGLRYAINKHSGRCFFTPIMDNEYFNAEKDSIFRIMAPPEEVFLMQMENMEYKGEAVARDITCDVWNGKHFHKLYNATFVKETYFSKDGWELQVDGTKEKHIPVRNVVIKKEMDGELLEGVAAYDFFQFTKTPPPLSSYAIQSCVDQIDHKRFAIELLINEEDREELFKFRTFFLEAAQGFLTNKTEINTPLRIQRLHIRQQSISIQRIFLVFSLLDKPNLRQPVSQSGKSLKDASVLLLRLVQAGNFLVSFLTPNGKFVQVGAGKNALHTLTADGKLSAALLKPAVINQDEGKVIEQKDEEETKDEGENKDVEEHKGMTSGHLALLAFAMLFIGVGIGIAIMYLYIRIYRDRETEAGISMQSVDAP